MKKIILTLVISILCLGVASVLFSLEKKSDKPDMEKTPSQVRLPLSKDIFFTASLNPNFIPIRNWTIEEPDIQAKAAAVFDPNGKKFLYQHNLKEKLPIASLTKIMTAIIALENLPLDRIVTISRKAVMTEGENGHLVIGEKLTVRDLLYIMLVESSNDAAVALADAVEDFVLLMNKKAREMGLEDTHFFDPTGISKWNYSSVFDLANLAEYSFNKSLIWQILAIKEIEIYSQNEGIGHHLTNTNELLEEMPQIVGGKTGFTEEAGGCMLTMIRVPDKPGEYLVVIVIGANNRELETKKLIEWVNNAYVW